MKDKKKKTPSMSDYFGGFSDKEKIKLLTAIMLYWFKMEHCPKLKTKGRK